MMKDAGQKDLLYRHLRAQGCFTMVEVPIAARERTGLQEKLVTDVDVLALRATPDFTWEVVVGDCKTRRGESPVNRSLWVRSIMDFMHARRGYLILRRDKGTIEPDHRLFADGLGVTLIDEEEFAGFDRAVLYPTGSSRFAAESASDLRTFYASVPERFRRLEPLIKLMSAAAWLERDHFIVMRRLIGSMQELRGEIDPNNPLHVALVLEAAAIFSVTLATCVGKAFHQYGLTGDRGALEDGLHVLLWGGRERFAGVVQLRDELRASRGIKGEEGDVFGLPRWPAFLQLVRSAMEAPRFAFRVPIVLRTIAMEEAGCIPRDVRPAHGMLMKLAMLTATYFVQAARLPPDMHERVRALLTERILEANNGKHPTVEREPVEPEQLSLNVVERPDRT